MKDKTHSSFVDINLAVRTRIIHNGLAITKPFGPIDVCNIWDVDFENGLPIQLRVDRQ